MSDVTNKRVVIYIDQDAAEDALVRLQAKANGFSNNIKKAKEEQEKLNKKIAELSEAGKDVSALQTRYNELSNRIAANTKSLKENEKAQAGIKEQIDKGLAPSFNQLQRYVNKLHNELKNMSQSQPGYAEKFNAYQNASTQLNNLKESFNSVHKAQKSWMSEVKTVAFGVLVGNTVQAIAESVMGYFSGIVSGNAKLSDSLSDVEKATNLTSEQVKNLNSELSKIDTRTSTENLRQIAIGLGQIGEAANKENVQAIDQIVVALGDEFGGGAKEITNVLGVLRNNLQDIKTGNYAQDVTHIGNALNVLGAEGLASAPVVTDIANRIAGISQTYKVSSGAILGIAATFQELGISSERGSTAITKLFQNIGSDPAKFAKVAGMSVKDFSALVNTDMVGAFQKVAEGVQKAGSNNVVFSKILKDLDADGSGAGEVLSKLGANAGLLSDKVGLATQALKENSSITEEFAKKNNNLAAELEKLNKDFNSFVQSKTLSDFFAASVRGLRHLIAALKELPTWLKENQVGILLIIAGLLTLNGAYIKAGYAIALNTAEMVKNTIATKAKAAWDVIVTASTNAYMLITSVLTGKITAATAAQRIWNAAMSMSLGPIGLIITLIGALVIALNGLPKSYTAAQLAANDFIDIQTQANKAITDERVNLSALLVVAKDETKSKQERQKAIDAINAKMPSYIEKLTLENIATDKGAKIINSYIEALGKKALAQAYTTKLQELHNKQIDIENEKLEENVSWYKALWAGITTGGKVTEGSIKLYNDAIKVKEKNKKLVQEEIDLVKKKFEQDVKNGKAVLDIPTPNNNKTAGGTNNDGGGGSGASSEEEKKAQQLLEKLKSFKSELEAIGKTSDEKEIDRINKKYNELMAEAAKHGVGLIGLSQERERAISYLLEQEEKKRKEFRAKVSKDADEEMLKNSLDSITESATQQKDEQLKLYAAGLITKKQLQAEERKIDLEALAFQIMVNESIANDETVNAEVRKKAADEVLKLKKQKNKEELADAVKTRDEIIEDGKRSIESAKRDALAKAQLGVLITREGTKARLDAELRLLDLERIQALSAANLTEAEKEKIKEEFRQREGKTVIDFYAKQVTEALNFISQGLGILDSFNQAQNSAEDRLLEEEIQRNDKRKQNVNELAKAKVITEIEAKKRIAEIDAENEKKRDELEKKQQARSKRIAIAQAIINGALAITSTLAAVPGATDILSLGAFRAIQIGMAIATTAAQIATISSTKYAKGGIADGASHAEGGIKLVDSRSNSVVGEMEGGEPYMILSKNFRRNNPDFIAAALDSSMNKNGARIQLPQWQTRPYRSLDFDGAVQNAKVVAFEKGGVFNKSASGEPMFDTGMKELMIQLINKIDMLASRSNTVQPVVIQNNISLNEIEEAAKTKATILAEAAA